MVRTTTAFTLALLACAVAVDARQEWASRALSQVTLKPVAAKGPFPTPKPATRKVEVKDGRAEILIESAGLSVPRNIDMGGVTIEGKPPAFSTPFRFGWVGRRRLSQVTLKPVAAKGPFPTPKPATRKVEVKDGRAEILIESAGLSVPRNIDMGGVTIEGKPPAFSTPFRFGWVGRRRLSQVTLKPVAAKGPFPTPKPATRKVEVKDGRAEILIESAGLSVPRNIDMGGVTIEGKPPAFSTPFRFGWVGRRRAQ